MKEDARGSRTADIVDRVVLPHLDAAYNLARWLVRNAQDAEDIVQEACLRAVKFFGGYQGGDGRSWFLKIVRNASYSFLEKNRPADLGVQFDETLHTPEPTAGIGPEASLLQSADGQIVRRALEELPATFREVLILRELEGMTYKEIAEVRGVPIGTVMSSLARARSQLRERILRVRNCEEQRGLPRE